MVIITVDVVSYGMNLIRYKTGGGRRQPFIYIFLYLCDILYDDNILILYATEITRLVIAFVWPRLAAVVIVVVIVFVMVSRVRRAIPIRRAYRRRPRRCHPRARPTRLLRCPGHRVPDLPVSWPIWSSERFTERQIYSIINIYD